MGPDTRACVTGWRHAHRSSNHPPFRVQVQPASPTCLHVANTFVTSLKRKKQKKLAFRLGPSTHASLRRPYSITRVLQANERVRLCFKPTAHVSESIDGFRKRKETACFFSFLFHFIPFFKLLHSTPLHSTLFQYHYNYNYNYTTTIINPAPPLTSPEPFQTFEKNHPLAARQNKNNTKQTDGHPSLNTTPRLPYACWWMTSSYQPFFSSNFCISSSLYTCYPPNLYCNFTLIYIFLCTA